jgi:hypothetical protein
LLYIKAPITSKETKGAGLQRLSYKVITYGEGDEIMVPKTVECWNQSALGGAPQFIIKVSPLWPKDMAVEGGIISMATVKSGVLVPQDLIECVKNGTPGSWKTIQERLDLEVKKEELRIIKSEKQMEEYVLVTKSREYVCPVCFLCTEPGCIRQYFSIKCLENHIEEGNHQSNGTAIGNSSHKIEPSVYDKMTVVDIALEALQKVTTAPDAELVEDNVVSSTSSSVQTPSDEILFDDLLVSLCVFGWAIKVKLNHPPIDPLMKIFLRW